MFDISTKDIIEINALICQKYGSPFAIREYNLLQSIPKGVNQTIFSIDAYPTLQDKVSYVVSSIAKNHIFLDANKRTAVLVYYTLCEKYNLPVKTENDIFKIILRISVSPFDIELTKTLLFN